MRVESSDGVHMSFNGGLANQPSQRGHMDFDTTPASNYPLPDLVKFLNRGFEDYFVPILFNIAAFLDMLRKDGIDLTASRVFIADDQPYGIWLIARRGWV